MIRAVAVLAITVVAFVVLANVVAFIARWNPWAATAWLAYWAVLLAYWASRQIERARK